jgi:Tol biopolymer transport system component
MSRKTFQVIFYILLSFIVLAGCTKTTEVVTLPPPPTDTQVLATKTPLKPTVTQVPATKTLPSPTDTPVMPTQTLEALPTASSINELPTTELVSVASDGTQGNAESYAPSISADGRYVTFSSNASNLVEGDTNGNTDIFVHDRVTGVTQRVSVASDGAQGYDLDNWITSSISADGRYVAFKSGADNLVEDDTGGIDCFVHDRLTGEITRVSVASNGAEGGSDGVAPAISADGRYVAFISYAPSIREGDTNLYENIFVHDRVTGQTTLESVSSEGIQGNNFSVAPSISADGRYVAFKSKADNLVEGDTNGVVDCFVHDQVSRETTRVSITSDGTQANAPCAFYEWALIFDPSISADGRYVAFNSGATNLVEGFIEYANIWGYTNIYSHDRVTGETTLVSVSSDGKQANGDSLLSAISADGRYVAFISDATNWEGGTSGDIFVHDRVTGKTTSLSIFGGGTRGWDRFWGSSFSADGRYLAFGSSADNLVEGDTNGVGDIFVSDLGTSK